MTDLERAKLELAATRARSAAFAAQLDEALRGLDRLEAAQAPLKGLAAQVAACHATEATLRAEIAALLHHREEARLLRRSTSWRLTRPLRALRHPKRALRLLLGLGWVAHSTTRMEPENGKRR